MLALFNLGSEVNTIYPIFTRELRLSIRPTDIEAQKFDSTMLDTFEIVVAAFSMTDKVNWVRFFEKTFLVANISREIVLGMFFLTLSGADIDFLGQELRWRVYTIKEAFPITRRIKPVGKKKFAAIALNLEYETYIVYVISVRFIASSNSFSLNVYPFCKPQIVCLIAEKAPIKIPNKYVNFVDIFSSDLAFKLLKHTKINEHAIELVDGQEPPYGPIYSLRPIDLATLKAYIKTNLANGFIRPSKLLASAPILFDQKLDGSLQLYVNYQDLNNLTIKNQYPLPLIEELLDRLSKTRLFTQLDLISAYYQMRIRKGDKWKTAFRIWYSYFE